MRGGVAWTLVMAVLAGCGGAAPTVSLGPPHGAIRHQDYGKLRERWTRTGRIIKQLDTTLRVHATLFAPEFNAAYVARRTHIFRLPDEERQRLARELSGRWASHFVFFVAAATIDYDWNDLSQKKSVWRVSLSNDRDEQVSASEIHGEPINATQRALFPFIGRFYRAYLVRFPKTLPDGRSLAQGSRNLELRFSGPLGQTDLVWRLR